MEQKLDTILLFKIAKMRITIVIFQLALLHYVKAENFVSNKMGQLYLSGRKWEIQYILNLTEYKETTELLQECTDTLTAICEAGQNPLCPYFLHETKYINTQVQIDISKMNHLSRQKRFIFLIPIVMGVSMLSFWAGMYVAKMTLESIKDNMHENLNIIEEAANITMSALSIQEQYIKDADIKFTRIENAINNNTQNIEQYAQFFGMTNTVLFMAQKHDKIQTKLNHIYAGNLKNRLFEIIDFSEYLEIMNKINTELQPNRH